MSDDKRETDATSDPANDTETAVIDTVGGKHDEELDNYSDDHPDNYADDYAHQIGRAHV